MRGSRPRPRGARGSPPGGVGRAARRMHFSGARGPAAASPAIRDRLQAMRTRERRSSHRAPLVRSARAL